MESKNNLDMTSYLIGYYAGDETGKREVVISGAITCTDDGDGNVTITQEE